MAANAQTPYKVKDINPGAANSTPGRMAELNGVLLFRADDGATGSELWKTDGTAAGTTMVKDISPGISGSSIGTPVQFNNKLYFAATTGASGTELWMSDGTAAGTTMVLDINAGSSSNPDNFRVVGSVLYFTATNGTDGVELWKTDGTAAGTVMVKDINPGSAGSTPTNLNRVGSMLMFMASDGANGTELWKSDGTAAGTVMVKDINTGAMGSLPTLGYPQLASNDTLYFFADDGTNGVEPWVSDGTTLGTYMLKDINPGFAASKTSTAAGIFFTRVGHEVFFSASDATNGEELWKTNGTTAGTVMVKDINPGGSSGCSGTSWYTQLSATPVPSNILYFTATNGVDGNELWMSDGTAAGTVQVKDVNPGAPSACGLIGLFLEHNGEIYFIPTTAANGYELWKTDGTAAGTNMIADINPGTGDGVAFTYGYLGDTLFFEGNDGTTGKELWALAMATTPPTAVTNVAAKAFTATAYPNPSRGMFSITANDDITAVEVRNMVGQTVYSATISANNATIDLTSQPKGIYIYQVRNAQGVVTIGKIVIE